MNRYHFGDSCTAKPDRHTPRHAGESPNLKDYLPDDRNTRTVVGLAAAFAMVVTGVVVGVPTDRGDANTSIQQPAERKSAESTGTPPQPAGLDSVIDQSPEERRIVIDRASRVSACDIRSQQGKLKKKVICTHPDVFAYLGASPAEESSSNMPQVFVDNREQSTSA